MRLLDQWRSALAKKIAPKPQGRQAWDAATFNRLTSDWINAWRRSADMELKQDLRTLRNRARDRLNNSPFGARYAQLLPENVLGPYGLRLQAKNKTLEGGLYKAANQRIEDAWYDAGRVGMWDLERNLTREEQLNLAVSQWGTDGEILLQLFRGPRFGRYGFAVQCLDPDFLDEEFNQARQGTLPLISQGVEYDEFNVRVAYWLWTQHPSESGVGNRKRVRIPASDIIHAFIPRRAGQTRGVPHLAAVLGTLKMLDGYMESEIVAARSAACKSGAIVDLSPEMGSVVQRAAGDPALGISPSVPADMEAGSFWDLRGMGARIENVDPQHPTDAFPDFTRTMAHYVAIGLGVSYGTLTGDLADATYSSMKVGQQPERDHWRRFTCFVVDHVCDRLYREWLAMALLNGAIPGIQDYDVNRWSRIKWQPRGFPSPDPLKDAQADYMHVAAGTKTLTEVCAEQGRDIEEVVDERAEENAMFAERGVMSYLPGMPLPPAESNQPDQSDGQPDEYTPARSLRMIRNA